ncbi:MAG: UbiD family decarboxylase, partial [Chloroflexota bacterium]
MPYYRNLREHLKALEEKGKLLRVKKEINKDTELHPLARLQFRGLTEEERQAFFFENVVDSTGRKYAIPVVVGALAGSSSIYAIGMMCQPEEIARKMAEAELHPIEPRLVSRAPVQEEVHLGDTLLQHGGLAEFPIPVTTPGYDIATYITAPCWITKDPQTGVPNVGMYRAMVKSPTRTGINWSLPIQGAFAHWRECKKRGIPLQAAIVVGGPPSVGYVAVTRFPHGVNEYAVAGGIAGEPLELVKCKTVEL